MRIAHKEPTTATLDNLAYKSYIRDFPLIEAVLIRKVHKKEK